MLPLASCRTAYTSLRLPLGKALYNIGKVKPVPKILLYIGIILVTYSVIMYLADFLPVDFMAFLKRLFSGSQSNEPYSKIVGVSSPKFVRWWAVIHWITLRPIQTIVELPEFQKRAAGLLKPDEKANVSKAERNELAKLTQLLLKHYCGSNG